MRRIYFWYLEALTILFQNKLFWLFGLGYLILLNIPYPGSMSFLWWAFRLLKTLTTIAYVIFTIAAFIVMTAQYVQGAQATLSGVWKRSKKVYWRFWGAGSLMYLPYFILSMCSGMLKAVTDAQPNPGLALLALPVALLGVLLLLPLSFAFRSIVFFDLRGLNSIKHGLSVALKHFFPIVFLFLVTDGVYFVLGRILHYDQPGWSIEAVVSFLFTWILIILYTPLRSIMVTLAYLDFVAEDHPSTEEDEALPDPI